MDAAEFKQQTNEFLTFSQYLFNRAKDTFPEAIESLSSAPQDSRVSPEQECELTIRKVGSLLNDLCLIHNKMYRAIGMDPIFPDVEQ